MELHPVRRSSASGAAFDQLFGEVVGGRARPGDSLPAERDLTERLQVNRQAVREALKRLAQAGLIDIRQGEPTKVLDFRRTASLDLLPHLLVREDGTPNPAVARSIMEMRASVGPDVARLAARRIAPETRTRLLEIVEEMRAADGDLEQLVALDLEFWDTLVDAADNIAYRLSFNSLRQTYEPLTETLSVVLAGELTDLETHRALAEAVGSGNEEAAHQAAATLLAEGTAAMSEALLALEGDGPEDAR